MRWVAHGLGIGILTVLTQLGGVAWALALLSKRRVLVFGVAYAALWGGAMVAAPLVSGRVALPCVSSGPMALQSPLYCLLNRHYVVPEMAAVLQDAAEAVDRQYPGARTLVLDGNFPFWDGFPLLPHLSHDDGEKADLAFYYQRDGVYLPGRAKSPIGYFAFEAGPTTCVSRFPGLRWDMGWLQPLWPNWEVEPLRMNALMAALSADPRVGKILLEPHLQDSLGVAHPKVRFQGCRAARHDDHIHLQL